MTRDVKKDGIKFGCRFEADPPTDDRPEARLYIQQDDKNEELLLMTTELEYAFRVAAMFWTRLAEHAQRRRDMTLQEFTAGAMVGLEVTDMGSLLDMLVAAGRAKQPVGGGDPRRDS